MHDVPSGALTVTLAQASTRLACGRFFSSAVLRRWRKMKGGRLPAEVSEMLEQAAVTLVQLILDDSISARGTWDDEHRSDRHGAREEIRHDFLIDGVYADPIADSILADWMGEHFSRSDAAYRLVELDKALFLGAVAKMKRRQLAMPRGKASSAAAISECRDHLIGLMKAGPKQQSKDLYRAEALRRSKGRLASRGFEDAWRQALKQVPSSGWNVPGRPKKKE